MIRREMESSFRPRRGLARGAYAERKPEDVSDVERSFSTLLQRVKGLAWTINLSRIEEQIGLEADLFLNRDRSWLSEYSGTLRAQLAGGKGGGSALVSRAVAYVSEVTRRCEGRQPSLEEKVVAVGMLRGRILTHGPGCDRGLSLILASAVAALGGVRVHVVCARDDRASDLEQRASSLLSELGIRFGFLRGDESLEARKKIWRSDVVFVGARNLVTEFLKDRLAMKGAGGRASLLVSRVISGTDLAADLRLQGLGLALLDDASSLLCDFAIRPFSVEDKEGLEAEERAQVLSRKLALELVEEEDYRLDHSQVRAELTSMGEKRLGSIGALASGLLSRPLKRRRFVERALEAEFIYQPGRHYDVVEGNVEFRLEGDCMVGTEEVPGKDLQRVLEVKEGVRLSRHSKIGVHSTLRRMLRRYLALGGATVSADGLTGEITRELDLPVVSTGLCSDPVSETYLLFESVADKNSYLNGELDQISKSGEGVWILSGNRDRVDEYRSLAQEGGFKLDDWAPTTADPQRSYLLSGKLGEEHPFGYDGVVVGPQKVIVADCLDARHHERQLLARLQAVQVQYLVCLEESLFETLFHSEIIRLIKWAAVRFPSLRPRVAKALVRLIYSRAEAVRRKARVSFATAEEEEHRQLAFTGPPTA